MFCLFTVNLYLYLMYIQYAKLCFLHFKECQGICTKEVILEVLEPFVREAIEDAFNSEEGGILFQSKKATDMEQVNVSYFFAKTTNLYLDMYLLFLITKEMIIYFVIYWLPMSLTLTSIVMKLKNVNILKYLTLIRSVIIIL